MVGPSGVQYRWTTSPYTGNPYVRICAGGAGNRRSYREHRLGGIMTLTLRKPRQYSTLDASERREFTIPVWNCLPLAILSLAWLSACEQNIQRDDELVRQWEAFNVVLPMPDTPILWFREDGTLTAQEGDHVLQGTWSQAVAPTTSPLEKANGYLSTGRILVHLQDPPLSCTYEIRDFMRDSVVVTTRLDLDCDVGDSQQYGFVHEPFLSAKSKATLHEKILRRAAGAGIRQAMIELARHLHTDDGIPRDDLEALMWLMIAAEGPFGIAEFGGGTDLVQTTLMTAAFLQSIERLTEEVMSGMSPEQVAEAKRLASAWEPDAVAESRKAAKTGEPEAQYQFAKVLETPDVVGEPRYEEAVEWYRKAAEQGHRDAQFALAVRYSRQRATQEDAILWYHSAAEQGHVQAQRDLGNCYRRGEGVVKDMVEAARWFRMAGENGDTPSQAWLGMLYEEGDGVPKDAEQAFHWYRMAAQYGNRYRRIKLAEIYADGTLVARNRVEAYKWALLGRAQTLPFFRALKEQMTAEQIREAEQSAQEWRPDKLAVAPPSR